MLTALENLYSVPFLDVTREATEPLCARGEHHLDALFPATCKLYDQKKNRSQHLDCEATRPFCARGEHHLDALFPATCKLYDQKKIGPNIWTAPSV